ncbi:hypothetical protein DICVIV_01161 [Dictyocaulus viviparus]|uniref:Uncharacterized protein n=1 Tax=Dictyocaulus viviparus TaxID=29172 RepID=A0A0D8Y7L6_DICVI|nr:hypothetical protein DICVIV_01161 [Dictyocaulus viviparus]
MIGGYVLLAIMVLLCRAELAISLAFLVHGLGCPGYPEEAEYQSTCHMNTVAALVGLLTGALGLGAVHKVFLANFACLREPGPHSSVGIACEIFETIKACVSAVSQNTRKSIKALAKEFVGHDGLDEATIILTESICTRRRRVSNAEQKNDTAAVSGTHLLSLRIWSITVLPLKDCDLHRQIPKIWSTFIVSYTSLQMVKYDLRGSKTGRRTNVEKF